MKIKHDCSLSQGCSWFQWAEPGFLQGMVAPLPRSLPSPCLQVGPKNSVLLPVHSPGSWSSLSLLLVLLHQRSPREPRGMQGSGPSPWFGHRQGRCWEHPVRKWGRGKESDASPGAVFTPLRSNPWQFWFSSSSASSPPASYLAWGGGALPASRSLTCPVPAPLGSGAG